MGRNVAVAVDGHDVVGDGGELGHGGGGFLGHLGDGEGGLEAVVRLEGELPDLHEVECRTWGGLGLDRAAVESDEVVAFMWDSLEASLAEKNMAPTMTITLYYDIEPGCDTHSST